MAQEFVNIGRRDIKRFDAPAKVLGTAKFSQDVVLPDMLYLKFVRSEYAHANIRGVDTSKAERLPGVAAVLTANDMPTTRFHFTRDKPVLASEKVRFVGDEIAAVVAEEEDVAEEAAELVEVDYEPLAVIPTYKEAMVSGAPLIHTDGNVIRSIETVRGDVEKGFGEATTIIERHLETPYYQHVCWETRSCVAAWIDGVLTMWGTTQWPHNSRDTIARSLGIPASKVRWIAPYVGGGFGNSSAEQWQVVAAMAAQKTGRPVKMVLQRNEDIINTTHRYTVIADLKVGAKGDGTLTACQIKSWVELGAYSHCMIALVDGMFPLLNGWVIPNLHLEGYEVYTNKPECGFLRDVGNFQGTFIANAIMMDVAKELNMDPLDFILKNQMDENLALQQDTQLPYSSCPQPAVAQAAAEAFRWRNKWKGWDQPISVEGSKIRGIGLAVGASSKGNMRPPMSGSVIVNFDGTAHILTGSADTGTGTGSTTLSIIAAEELGVRFEDVQTTWADTGATQDTGMQNGSTMTRSGGMGILMAARDAKQQIFEIAAPLLGVEPEELEARDRKVYVKENPENSMTLAEVMSKAPAPIIGRGNYIRPGGWVNCHFHTAMGEVEVDMETGQVRILDYVASHGIGTVIFRRGAEDQVEGAATTGIDHTLFGHHIWDEVSGAPLNANLLDYGLPTFLDVPKDIVPVFVEQNDPIGPFGAVGLGEPPNEPPPAVVRNAILHATGARIDTLPIQPNFVLKALGKVR